MKREREDAEMKALDDKIKRTEKLESYMKNIELRRRQKMLGFSSKIQKIVINS